ncbi:MAG: hypothetical protein M3N26_01300, partial [Pseudomonadota bacterium]|nr:hypothetical protein [Pseudomonadota bacterium]
MATDEILARYGADDVLSGGQDLPPMARAPQAAAAQPVPASAPIRAPEPNQERSGNEDLESTMRIARAAPTEPDRTPTSMAERAYSWVTRGRNLHDDMATHGRMPGQAWDAFGEDLNKAHEDAQALHDKAKENMTSGSVGKTILGVGQ